MSRMLVICPTYKRVGMCADMIESFQKTAVNQDYYQTQMVLGLSEDDPTLEAYIKLAERKNIGVYISKSKSITKIINDIYKLSKHSDAYHITNDDVIYRSENWHFVFMMMLEQKGGGIVYANDLLQGRNLCTFPCISANVAKAVGWLQYPRLKALCGDLVWMEIGVKAKCIYYNDEIIIEHLSWINNKRGHDKPEYQAMFLPDQLHYNHFVENDRDAIVERVKGLFDVIPKN